MADHCYAECRYAECHVLFIIMPSAIKLNVVAPIWALSSWGSHCSSAAKWEKTNENEIKNAGFAPPQSHVKFKRGQFDWETPACLKSPTNTKKLTH